MPRYDYQCPQCGAVREVTHGMNELPEVNCETILCANDCVCASRMVKQLGTFGGFTFKGSGFYATDYKRKR